MANKSKGSKKKGAANRKKPSKRTIALRVIPEPEPDTRSVLSMVGSGTVALKGDGSNLVMECGNCGAPLIEGAPMTSVQNLVFRCNRCGEYNETMA